MAYDIRQFRLMRNASPSRLGLPAFQTLLSFAISGFSFSHVVIRRMLLSGFFFFLIHFLVSTFLLKFLSIYPVPIIHTDSQKETTAARLEESPYAFSWIVLGQYLP